MALIECSECGKEISDRARSCPSCGFTKADNGFTPTSRSMTVLLAMLGGSFGLHKFYLNRPGLGALYLCFCWTFIPMILGFLEGLYYLSLNEGDFRQRYAAGAGFTETTSTVRFNPAPSLIAGFLVWLLVFFGTYGILIIALLQASTETQHYSVWALPIAILITLLLRFIAKKISSKKA